jgi:hypothetical protein
MKGSPSALARRHAFPIAVFLFIATMRKIFSVWQTSSGKTRFVIDLRYLSRGSVYCSRVVVRHARTGGFFVSLDPRCVAP